MLASDNLPALLEAGYDIDFHIYTFSNERWLFQSFPSFQKLVTLCHIELRDITPQSERYGNKGLMAYCHEQSLIEAGMNTLPVMLLCSDAIFIDGTFPRLLKHVEQGRKLVLQSAIRIADKQVMPKLAKIYNGAYAISLSRSMAESFVIDHMHDDEKQLAMPSQMCAYGWPGIPSWKEEGIGYAKCTPYFNPAILVAEPWMKLNGATIDNAPLIGELLNRQGAVHICTSYAEGGVLDLAPDGINQLPLKNGRQSPLDFAARVAFGFIAGWQHELFHHIVFVAKNDNDQFHPAVREKANNFIQHVDKFVNAILQNPVDFHDLKTSIINDYYDQFIHVDEVVLAEKIACLVELLQTKKVLLYGGGDFFHFISSRLFSSDINFLVSDQSEIKRLYWAQMFDVVSPHAIADMNVIQAVVPMSMEHEYTMKAFLKEIGVRAPVMIFNWGQIKRNEKAA
jgi:hypothetical protein